MALPPFRFSLEPKRIEAGAERDRTLTELRELEREHARAREQLLAALQVLRRAAQRLRSELDDQRRRPLTAADAREWTWSCQYVEQLRELRRQCERSAQRRREALALERLRLENKRTELAEQQERLDVLERAREREAERHRRAVERDEERRRDDDAPLYWSRTEAERKRT